MAGPRLPLGGAGLVACLLALGQVCSACSRDWDELVEEARKREADGGGAAQDDGGAGNDDAGAGALDGGVDAGAMPASDGAMPPLDAGTCDDPSGCEVATACQGAGGDADEDGICDDDDICFGDNDSGDEDGDGYCDDRECVIRVSPNGDDTSSGSSWDEAVASVQQGIDNAQDGCCDVWVAAGQYVPNRAGGDTDPPDPRTLSFELTPCVSVYGGFSGDETSRAERPSPLLISELSGEIGVLGDDTDNAYHVVTASADMVLDGFVVDAGRAEPGAPQPHNMGGGIFGDNADSLLLRDLVVIGNQAERGGGMLFINSSGVKLLRVQIEQNVASADGAGIELVDSDAILDQVQLVHNAGPLGAGLRATASDVSLIATLVADNTGTGVSVDNAASPDLSVQLVDSMLFANYGGGLDAIGAQVTLEGSLVAANDGAALGGGLVVSEGSLEINGSALTQNYTTTTGAAVYAIGGTLSAFDTTFVENYAEQGGGAIWADGDVDIQSSDFAHNGTSGGGGGALGSNGVGTINIVNSAFNGNSAAMGDGGAVYMLGMSTAYVSGCSFLDNAAYGSGGVIYFEGPEISLLNTAAYQNAPDMLLSMTGATTVDWICSDNPPASSGHAITLDDSSQEYGNPFLIPYSDQLYLSQTPGNGGSVCLDAGDDATADYDVPYWAELTTEVYGTLDVVPVDLGRHYSPAQPRIDSLSVSNDVVSWATTQATRCMLMLYGEDINFQPVVNAVEVDYDELQSGALALDPGFVGTVTMACFGDGEPAVASGGL